MLKGKKTILAGSVMIVFNVAGFLLGTLDANAAVQGAITGASFIFVRLGIGGS